MAAATSKMERFVTKRSILDVEAVLEPPLIFLLHSRSQRCWPIFVNFLIMIRVNLTLKLTFTVYSLVYMFTFLQRRI